MSFWTGWVWDGAHIAVGAAELLAAGGCTAWLLRRRPNAAERRQLVTGEILEPGPGLTDDGWQPAASYRCASPHLGSNCTCRFCKRAKAFRRETGAPVNHQCLQRHKAPYRCDFCGDRLRRSIVHPGWENKRYHRLLSLCFPCVEFITGKPYSELSLHEWSSFDIVR